MRSKEQKRRKEQARNRSFNIIMYLVTGALGFLVLIWIIRGLESMMV